MKFQILPVCALIAAVSLHAEVLFQGVVVAGPMQQFALQDTTRGYSRWCKLGDPFGDLLIKSYNAERETLVCATPGGVEVQLKLNSSVVRELKSTPIPRQQGRVFVAPDLLEALKRQGKDETDIFAHAVAALEAELANAPTEQDRAGLRLLIDGLKAGRGKLYSTGGRPLSYADAPELSKDAVDRINQLQTMSKEQVDAMIKARNQAKQNPQER